MLRCISTDREQGPNKNNAYDVKDFAGEVGVAAEKVGTIRLAKVGIGSNKRKRKRRRC